MNVKKVTSSGNGTLDGRYKIVGARLVAGTDAATAILYDNASAQSGDELCKLSAKSANAKDKECWEHVIAPKLSNGLSVTLSGTDPILYVYYV